jgi:hypothetical protein
VLFACDQSIRDRTNLSSDSYRALLIVCCDNFIFRNSKGFDWVLQPCSIGYCSHVRLEIQLHFVANFLSFFAFS